MSLYSEQQLEHYIIKDQIACGGMGEVWRAWDELHNRFVALKVITDDLFFDPNFADRFVDEVRRHLKLTHPNIVQVLDVFHTDNQNCLVMDLIEGTSLAGLLKSRQDRRLALSEAIPIIQDLLNALNYAHTHGIIHRDVKPSNVLLDKAGRGYLIDFGIALAVGEDRRTRTGQTIGTPHYMSPEQIISPRTIDHRSDVYSVGCVFYEMLTGRPPFIVDPGKTGDTDFEIKKAHVNTQPVPPSQRVNTIPVYIDNIILFALQKKPENRLPGCQEFLRLLSEGEIQQSVKPKVKVRWVYLLAFILAILWLLFISLLLIK